MKKEFFNLFSKLCAVQTVGGCERENALKIAQICREETDFYDSIRSYSDGSIVLFHNSKKSDAKTLMIDAHIDTVGFVVKKVQHGGFLSVAAVGGIDKRILPSQRVEIYGKRTICGVFVSTPPHLQTPSYEYPELENMYVDTGLTKEELEEICPVGTRCSYLSESRMCADSIMSKHLDDKICAASALFAARFLKKQVDINVILSFSAAEECASVGIFNRLKKEGILPDGALVLDVNFAKEDGVCDRECHKSTKGAGISYSSSTNRAFTDSVLLCAKRNGVDCQTVVEAANTGTNAHALAVVATGIPTCVASVPIRHMHTPCEVAYTRDAIELSRLLACVMEEFGSFEIGKRYIKRRNEE